MGNHSWELSAEPKGLSCQREGGGGGGNIYKHSNSSLEGDTVSHLAGKALFREVQKLLSLITNFRKSASHRKFYASIQQQITDNPWSGVSHCPLAVTPLPSASPSSPPTSPSSSPSFLTTVLYKTYYWEGIFFNEAKVSTNLLQTWYNVMTGLLSREQCILFNVKKVVHNREYT